MTMIPSNVGALTEVPTFDTEDKLYQWMDATVGDSYERAKETVAEWWSRTVTALVAADEFYGFNTLGGNGRKRTDTMSERLQTWCSHNGLNTPDKISQARAIGRAWLCLDKPDLNGILDEIAPSNMVIVGSGDTRFVGVKYEAALNGATFGELKELQSNLHNDPEYLEEQLVAAINLRDKALAERDHAKQKGERLGVTTRNNPDYQKACNDYRSACQSVSKIEATLAAATERWMGLGSSTENSPAGEQYTSLPDQLQQAQVEADAARKALESYTGQKSDRIKQYAQLKQADRDARIKLCRLQELVDGLPKQEEPQEKTVDPEYQALVDQVAALSQQNLELLEVAKKKEQEDQEYLIMQEEIKRLEKSKKHIEFKFEQLSNPYSNDQSTLELRLHIIRNTGNHWEELALTFPEARSITKDPFTLGQAERAIMSSWDAWIKHLPMDMIHELQQKIEQRIAAGDATTPPANYTTVDIVAV
jgi:hypothetical protein